MSSKSARRRRREGNELQKDMVGYDKENLKKKTGKTDAEWKAIGVPQWLIDKVNERER